MYPSIITPVTIIGIYTPMTAFCNIIWGKAGNTKKAPKTRQYTTVLAKIYNDALKKYKNSKGGTKTEKARRELQRLARPGLNAPFNKNYDASLKKIFKNKMKASDFHLKKVDKVFINLEYRFLNQPGATKTKTKTKGTKK